MFYLLRIVTVTATAAALTLTTNPKTSLLNWLARCGKLTTEPIVACAFVHYVNSCKTAGPSMFWNCLLLRGELAVLEIMRILEEHFYVPSIVLRDFPGQQHGKLSQNLKGCCADRKEESDRPNR